MRFDLNQRDHPELVSKQGLKHLEEHLRAKLAAFKLLVADRLFKWEVPDNTGYRSVKHPFFTGYFRANWDVSIGERKTAPLLPESERPKGVTLPFDDAKRMFEGEFQPNRVLETLGGRSVAEIMAKPILIYNNTWYGAWLNNGGYNAETYLKTWPPERVTERREEGANHGVGSRFMERGFNYMAREFDYKPIIREARENFGRYVKKG